MRIHRLLYNLDKFFHPVNDEDESILIIIAYIANSCQHHDHDQYLDKFFHPIHNKDESILIIIADVSSPHPALIIKGLLVRRLVVAGDDDDDHDSFD